MTLKTTTSLINKQLYSLVSPQTLDIFKYKSSLKMTDIGLTEQVGDSSTKFEIWFRKRKPSDTYLLQAPTLELKGAWTEEISKLLWRQVREEMRDDTSQGIFSKMLVLHPLLIAIL